MMSRNGEFRVIQPRNREKILRLEMGPSQAEAQLKAREAD